MNEFLNLLSDVWNSGLFGISLGPIISSIFTIIVALLLRGFVINWEKNFEGPWCRYCYQRLFCRYTH